MRRSEEYLWGGEELRKKHNIPDDWVLYTRDEYIDLLGKDVGMLEAASTEALEHPTSAVGAALGQKPFRAIGKSLGKGLQKTPYLPAKILGYGLEYGGMVLGGIGGGLAGEEIQRAAERGIMGEDDHHLLQLKREAHEKARPITSKVAEIGSYAIAGGIRPAPVYQSEGFFHAIKSVFGLRSKMPEQAKYALGQAGIGTVFSVSSEAAIQIQKGEVDPARLALAVGEGLLFTEPIGPHGKYFWGKPSRPPSVSGVERVIKDRASIPPSYTWENTPVSNDGKDVSPEVANFIKESGRPELEEVYKSARQEDIVRAVRKQKNQKASLEGEAEIAALEAENMQIEGAGLETEAMALAIMKKRKGEKPVWEKPGFKKDLETREEWAKNEIDRELTKIVKSMTDNQLNEQLVKTKSTVMAVEKATNREEAEIQMMQRLKDKMGSGILASAMRLAAQRDITVKVALNKLIDSTSGKALGGVAHMNKDQIVLSLSDMHPDTPFHEIVHKFVGDMINSSNEKDSALAKRWISDLLFDGKPFDKKLSQTDFETRQRAFENIATEGGAALLKRLSNVPKSRFQRARRWLADSRRGAKLKWGKASKNEILDYISQRIELDPPRAIDTDYTLGRFDPFLSYAGMKELAIVNQPVLENNFYGGGVLKGRHRSSFGHEWFDMPEEAVRFFDDPEQYPKPLDAPTTSVASLYKGERLGYNQFKNLAEKMDYFEDLQKRVDLEEFRAEFEAFNSDKMQDSPVPMQTPYVRLTNNQLTKLLGIFRDRNKGKALGKIYDVLIDGVEADRMSDFITGIPIVFKKPFTGDAMDVSPRDTTRSHFSTERSVMTMPLMSRGVPMDYHLAKAFMGYRLNRARIQPRTADEVSFSNTFDALWIYLSKTFHWWAANESEVITTLLKYYSSKPDPASNEVAALSKLLLSDTLNTPESLNSPLPGAAAYEVALRNNPNVRLLENYFTKKNEGLYYDSKAKDFLLSQGMEQEVVDILPAIIRAYGLVGTPTRATAGHYTSEPLNLINTIMEPETLGSLAELKKNDTWKVLNNILIKGTKKWGVLSQKTPTGDFYQDVSGRDSENLRGFMTRRNDAYFTNRYIYSPEIWDDYYKAARLRPMDHNHPSEKMSPEDIAKLSPGVQVTQGRMPDPQELFRDYNDIDYGVSSEIARMLGIGRDTVAVDLLSKSLGQASIAGNHWMKLGKTDTPPADSPPTSYFGHTIDASDKDTKDVILQANDPKHAKMNEKLDEWLGHTNLFSKVMGWQHSSIDKLRKAGANTEQNKAANFIADKWHHVFAEERRLIGKYVERMMFSIGEVKLSSEEDKALGLYQSQRWYKHRGRIDEIDPELQKMYDASSRMRYYDYMMANNYHDTRRHQNNEGLLVWTKYSGLRPGIFSKEYTADIIEQSVRRDIMYDPKSGEDPSAREVRKKELFDFWEEQHKRKDPDKEITDETRQKWVSRWNDIVSGLKAMDKKIGSHHFRALRVASGEGMPIHWIEPSAINRMTRYAVRYAKDMAFFTHMESDQRARSILGIPDQSGKYEDAYDDKGGPFGVKMAGDKENPLRVDAKDIDSVVTEGGKGRFPRIEALYTHGGIDEVMGGYIGFYEGMDLAMRTLNRSISSLWLGYGAGIRDLLTSYMFNLPYMRTQDLPIFLTHWWNFRSAWIKSHAQGVNKTHYQNIEFNAESVNKHADFANRYLADTASRVGGRNLMERITRASQFAMGQQVVWTALRLRPADAIFGKDITADRLLRTIDRHMGPIKVLGKKRRITDYVGQMVPEEVLDSAAAAWVEINQGTYDVRGLPLWTQRGGISWFTSLSRWGIDKSNMMEKHALAPLIKEGDPRPLIKAAFGGVLGGAAVYEVSELIANKLNANPSVLEAIHMGNEDEMLTSTVNLIALGGFFGWWGQLAHDIMSLATGRGVGNLPGGFVLPILSFMDDVVKKELYDAGTAIAHGQAPFFETLTKALHKAFRSTAQSFRNVGNWLYLDEEMSESNARRNLRVFSRLRRESPAQDQREMHALGNAYTWPRTSDFKSAKTVYDAAAALPQALDEIKVYVNALPEGERNRAFNKKVKELYQTQWTKTPISHFSTSRDKAVRVETRKDYMGVDDNNIYKDASPLSRAIGFELEGTIIDKEETKDLAIQEKFYNKLRRQKEDLVRRWAAKVNYSL